MPKDERKSSVDFDEDIFPNHNLTIQKKGNAVKKSAAKKWKVTSKKGARAGLGNILLHAWNPTVLKKE